MPKFLVPITRDATETTMVDVEAANRAEAILKALGEAYSEPQDFNWTPDDNSGDQSTPYFGGDVEEIEEVADAQ